MAEWLTLEFQGDTNATFEAERRTMTFMGRPYTVELVRSRPDVEHGVRVAPTEPYESTLLLDADES